MIATLAPAKPKLLTAEGLLRLDSKGVKGELIRGEFCEGDYIPNCRCVEIPRRVETRRGMAV